MPWMKYLFAFAAVIICAMVTTVMAQQKHIGPMDVVVYDKSTPVPGNAEYIDDVVVAINGEGKRADERLMFEARWNTSKLKANVLKVKKISRRYFPYFNTIELQGEAYLLKDAKVVPATPLPPDNVSETLLPPDSKFALLYIYRARNRKGKRATAYKVFVNDEEVMALRTDNTAVVKIEKEGFTVLRGGGDEKELSVDVVFGKAYFIKCGIVNNNTYTSPDIILQPAVAGYKEYKDTE